MERAGSTLTGCKQAAVGNVHTDAAPSGLQAIRLMRALYVGGSRHGILSMSPTGLYFHRNIALGTGNVVRGSAVRLSRKLRGSIPQVPAASRNWLTHSSKDYHSLLICVYKKKLLKHLLWLPELRSNKCQNTLTFHSPCFSHFGWNKQVKWFFPPIALIKHHHKFSLIFIYVQVSAVVPRVRPQLCLHAAAAAFLVLALFLLLLLCWHFLRAPQPHQ